MAGRRIAPYKRFAGGKSLAQGEFISPEHLERPRVPRQTWLLGIRQEEMRTLGTVQLPTEAFMAVLKLDED